MSNSSSSSPVIVPTPSTISIEPEDERSMETTQENSVSTSALQSQKDKSAPQSEIGPDESVAKVELGKAKTKKSRKRDKAAKHTKSKKSKRVVVESSSEDSSSDSESSDSSSSEDESSEDEEARRREKKRLAKKKMKKKAAAKAKAKARKRKGRKYDSSSDDSDSDSSNSSSSSASSSSSSSSDSDSETEREEKHRKKKKSKKSKKSKKVEQTSETSSDEAETKDAPSTPEAPEDDETEEQLIKKLIQKFKAASLESADTTTKEEDAKSKETKKNKKEKAKKKKKGGLEYKRVDQVWDSETYDYKYEESAEKKKDDYDCVFTVRRKFTWDNRYEHTMVDVKSNLLQDVLKEVLKDVKGLSLVEETPAIDPNMLFLYYEELKQHYKKTLRARLRKEKKKKKQKRLTEQIAQCKLLVGYIDKDYEATRKILYPMLKVGNITWDLIWAIFKPNTMAYTPTYGNKDDPRCFKVDCVTKDSDIMGREWWTIQGHYLDYDGEIFGFDNHSVIIPSFKGPNKVTGLPTYPLSYHKDPVGLTKTLVERGKKFIALQGINYRLQKGIAYQKGKRCIIKHNIDGRVMIDPALFRRINPNYGSAYVKDKQDETDDGAKKLEHRDHMDSDSDSDSDEDEAPRFAVYKDKNGRFHHVEIPAGGDIADLAEQKLDPIRAEDGSTHTFSEEELIIASPVVLGFSFSEKQWVEFSLSGVREIEWNAEAFDSLVLPAHIKQNLKGLVSSHRFNAAKTIDDVIQGKGKGLNVVLHGPPGVGKTLTGESIADFLKCPLYAVSAGELGTDSRSLEADLNRIMDMAHSWGALLLLDEADVFLEQRQAQDLHRNSLVSVFLRLLEYYQGILFLTTNRVATFDEAIQSRIHMGVRYENLGSKARREIWQYHIRKIEALDNQESVPFKEVDFEQLSKKDLNGRQIKNTVITAQSIALAEEKPFSLEYVKRVLDIAEEFEVDMRGGLGHREAMMQYT